jgi:tetratricopeptide (TPR) repeat protein
MKPALLIAILASAITLVLPAAKPLRAANVANPNSEPPLTEEEKMREAIRDFAGFLEVPSKARFAQNPSPETRFNNACTALEKTLEMPAGSLRQDLRPYADQLLKNADAPALDHASALFVTGKYADAETSALRLVNDPKALELAGRCDMQLGDPEHALIRFHSAAGLIDQQRAPLDWATVQRDIAILLLNVGRLDEAENTWRRVLQVQLANLHAEHNDVLNTRSLLAFTLSREGRFGDAAAQLHEILTALEKSRGADDVDTKIARQNYERMLKAAGGRP